VLPKGRSTHESTIYRTSDSIKAIVFYCSLAAFCQTAQAQSEVKFRTLRETVIVVPVMLNGAGPFDFVLDTGTDTTLLDSDLAQRLSLRAIDRTQLNTVAGSQIAVRTYLSTLAIVSARAKDLEALVADLRELRKMDSRIAGVVGQNFLSQFNYLLDSRKHSLRFETAAEIRQVISEERVPLEVKGQRMLVPADMQSASQEKLFLLLDSGASSLVLFRRGPLAASLAMQSSFFELTTANASGSLAAGRVRFLKVGPQIFHNLAVALSAPSPSDALRAEDGLLPTALFHSLYVNNHERFVVFNPRLEPRMKNGSQTSQR